MTPTSTRLCVTILSLALGARAYAQKIPEDVRSVRPFRTYAVGLRLGSGGIGGELATPLSRHLDLRGGGQAFHYSTSFSTNGLNATGRLELNNAYLAIGYFPFHNGFRIAPGVTFHNRNNVYAVLNEPSGSTFTLNDVDYTSQPGDPVKGNASVVFGKMVAPRLTLGWGNMFPSRGRRFSFPVEVGAEYASAPIVTLAFSGSACTNQGCGSINTPENMANIAAERNKLNANLSPLRFYPIVSFGIAYRISR